MTLLRILLLMLPLQLAAAALDAERQRVVLSLNTEPPSLDSATATNNVSIFVLSHLKEGLLQYGPNGELIAGVAERWELRDDGATFWLRRDARWNDGRPVTAQDFVFAWRRLVDPATASQYAFIMYPLLNAEAINRGDMPVDTLGVRAEGDHRLEVSFHSPCPYFLSLTAFMSYYPQRADAVEKWGRAYAADFDTQYYNGPFALSRWVHGAHLTLSRNPQYWSAETVHLSEIDLPYVTADASAKYNLFKDGAIAMATLDSGTLADALAKGYQVEQFRSGNVYFLEFNFREGRVTANRPLRKAMQAVLDPALLVYKVIGLPGVLPAYSLFPMTVKAGDGKRFRDVYPAPRPRYDLAEARRWIQQASRELGFDEWPPLVILVNDTPAASKQAEYYQYLLSRALGLRVLIEKQTFKQYIEKMRRGDFDIALAGWGPDFDDAQTYGELFTSWNENNRGAYSNPEYDRWMRVAMTSRDPAQRFAAFAEVQRLIVEDVPIIPAYENAEQYVVHPRLQGMVRSIFGGDPNLRFARVKP